jgi:CubicO group peptidase (beta-lactamase class C family)
MRIGGRVTRVLGIAAVVAAWGAIVGAQPIDWTATIAAFDAGAAAQGAAYALSSLLVGNATHTWLSYTRGGFDAHALLAVASATKWVTAAAVMRVVEATAGWPRPLRLDSRPSDLLAAWQPNTAAANSTANMTLAQLLSFTSGMDDRQPCSESAGAPGVGFAACIAALNATYNTNGTLPYPAGTTMFYCGSHLHLAGAMAAAAWSNTTTPTAASWSAVYHAFIRNPLGWSTSAFFTPIINPLLAGGLLVSTSNYTRFLQVRHRAGGGGGLGRSWMRSCVALSTPGRTQLAGVCLPASN